MVEFDLEEEEGSPSTSRQSPKTTTIDFPIVNPYNIDFQARFKWGTVRLFLHIASDSGDGHISQPIQKKIVGVQIDTDCLDDLSKLKEKLVGTEFTHGGLTDLKKEFCWEERSSLDLLDFLIKKVSQSQDIQEEGLLYPLQLVPRNESETRLYEWMVGAGNPVLKDQELVYLDHFKMSEPLLSPINGKVEQILVPDYRMVTSGGVVAMLREYDGSPSFLGSESAE